VCSQHAYGEFDLESAGPVSNTTREVTFLPLSSVSLGIGSTGLSCFMFLNACWMYVSSGSAGGFRTLGEGQITFALKKKMLKV
jgi:hypothetical protein